MRALIWRCVRIVHHADYAWFLPFLARLPLRLARAALYCVRCFLYEPSLSLSLLLSLSLSLSLCSHLCALTTMQWPW